MRRRTKWVLIVAVAAIPAAWLVFAVMWTLTGGLFGGQPASWGLFQEGLEYPPLLATVILGGGWDRVFPRAQSHSEAGGGCSDVQVLLPIPPAEPAPELQVRERDGHVYYGWATRAQRAAGEANAFEEVPQHKLASREEWDGAAPVDPREVLSEGPPGERYFVFHGRRYRPSGSRWFGERARASLSPDKQRLAMATFDGPIWPSALFHSSPPRRWWTVHLEAFDVATATILLHWVDGHIPSAVPPRDPHPVWAVNGLIMAGGGTAPFTVHSCPVAVAQEIPF